MDRKGRRPMLLYGFAGMTVGLVMLTLALSLDASVRLCLLFNNVCYGFVLEFADS